MKFTLALAANLLAGVAVAAPKRPCPEDSFALEGYAKENPLGETTGGEGGPTTTIIAADALATAVQVRKSPTKRPICLVIISDPGRAMTLSQLSSRETLTYLRASKLARTRALLAIAMVQPSLVQVSLSRLRIM